MRRSGVLIQSLMTTFERRRSSSLMMSSILHPNPPITSHFAVNSLLGMLGMRHDSWISPLCPSSFSVYFSSVPEVASSPRIEEESGVNLQSKMDENAKVDLDNNYTKNDFSDRNGDGNVNGHHRNISSAEAKRLLRLVNVEALKKRLETMEGKEVIDYASLISECQAIGVARSAEEAAAFTKVLDEAGVVLVFRDKVYLHPDKVAELVTNAMPLALAPKDDPRIEELKNLQKMKEEIDAQAHRQVRGILWTGLGFSVAQVGLFFRLTFWEFSWDVMEPITFFTTTTGLVVGYAYFLITSRDPTYEDVLKRLFKSRQRKIIQKLKFNEARFDELQRQLKFPCKCASDVEALIKG